MRGVMLGACAALLLGVGAAAAGECAPDEAAKFVSGVDNVEDFAQLPNGQLIGGDLAVPGKQGCL